MTTIKKALNRIVSGMVTPLTTAVAMEDNLVDLLEKDECQVKGFTNGHCGIVLLSFIV